VATRSGLSARDAVLRSRVEECSPDAESLLEDPEVDLVVIATRHDQHADLVLRSLVHDKKVFVEKPLCLREEELVAIEREVRQRDAWVMVGFNRRFAPLVLELREGLPPGPKSVQVRVNAGPLPADSWYRDPEVGGGRVQGEIAHFLDLVSFITSERIVRVHAESVRCPGEPADTVAATLSLGGGSVATIHYTSLGSGSYSKEMLEVFCGGQAFGVDNFRRAVLCRGGKVRKVRGRGQDKGHRAEMEALLRSARGSVPAVPFEDAVAATRATFALLRSLVTGQPVEVEVGSGPEISPRGDDS
jgi:polar amino acid transport system substrate-binding protein